VPTYYLWLVTNLPNGPPPAAPVEVTVTDLQGAANNATLARENGAAEFRWPWA
jgi:hypothetical protein